MKTKKFLTLFTMIFSPILLQSCFFLGQDNINNLPVKKVTYGTPTYTSSYLESNMDVRHVNSSFGWEPLPSKGNSKLLVIPVETSDVAFTSNQIKLIQDGFFGSSSSTGWESVTSYYQKSSKGLLNISGTVAPKVRLNKSSSTIQREYSLNNGSSSVTDDILKTSLNTLANNSSINLKDFDSNNDGIIDAVWMVYSPNYSTEEDTPFWAYTTGYPYNNKFSNMYASCYSWASVKFFSEGGYKNASGETLPDSHTFIHETGHMLGLDDYYSYDYDYDGRKGNCDTPVGCIDMMDFNVGDHMAFSKYLLGWEEPIVLDSSYFDPNSGSIELKSHTETNTSILIPSLNYNNTPYDEYLLLEYYSPTNLNAKDVLPYSNGAYTYSQPGLLVYHIDNRVGKMIYNSQNKTLSWDGNKYDKLPSFDEPGFGQTYLFSSIYSNTRSRSYETSLQASSAPFYRGFLCSLLAGCGKKIEQGKTSISSYKNQGLFKKGNQFSKIYNNFIFDDGSKPAYDFKLSNTSSTSCTIEFSKVEE